jgi:hypothetical protein
MHLGWCVRLDFEDAEAGWIGCSGDGGARGLFTVVLLLAVATSTWCTGFDVVLETHVFGKSVRARERFIALYEIRRKVSTGQRNKWGEMRTGKLAGEGFLARVGSEVRDKCEARSLREATTSARGPFTGVVGFVHANVICGGQKNIMSGRSGRNEEAKLEEKSGAPSCRWRMNVLKTSKASPQSSH